MGTDDAFRPCSDLQCQRELPVDWWSLSSRHLYTLLFVCHTQTLFCLPLNYTLHFPILNMNFKRLQLLGMAFCTFAKVWGHWQHGKQSLRSWFFPDCGHREWLLGAAVTCFQVSRERESTTSQSNKGYHTELLNQWVSLMRLLIKKDRKSKKRISTPVHIPVLKTAKKCCTCAGDEVEVHPTCSSSDKTID